MWNHRLCSDTNNFKHVRAGVDVTASVTEPGAAAPEEAVEAGKTVGLAAWWQAARCLLRSFSEAHSGEASVEGVEERREQGQEERSGVSKAGQGCSCIQLWSHSH